jgi:hypothetical protein
MELFSWKMIMYHKRKFLLALLFVFAGSLTVTIYFKFNCGSRDELIYLGPVLTSEQAVENYDQRAMDGDLVACAAIYERLFYERRFAEAAPYLRIAADNGDQFAAKILANPEIEWIKLQEAIK